MSVPNWIEILHCRNKLETNYIHSHLLWQLWSIQAIKSHVMWCIGILSLHNYNNTSSFYHSLLCDPLFKKLKQVPSQPGLRLPSVKPLASLITLIFAAAASNFSNITLSSVFSFSFPTCTVLAPPPPLEPNSTPSVKIGCSLEASSIWSQTIYSLLYSLLCPQA